MDELKPCPSRWEHAVNLLNIYRNAHYNDPMGESCELANAINDILPFAVNAYHRTAPENKAKALTLDELKQMKDGTFEVRQINNVWKICADEATTFRFEEYLFKDYGKTWLAYARKPENQDLREIQR